MADSLDDSAERTEPATPKKREDTRRKGIVSKSVEVNSAMILFFGLLVMQAACSMMAEQIAAIARSVLSEAGRFQLTPASIQGSFASGMLSLAVAVGPVLLGLVIIGLAANMAQVGFRISPEALEIKWSKLNPLKAVKMIFGSQRSMVEMLKNLVKVVLVGIVAYSAVSSVVEDSVSLMDGSVGGILGFLTRATFGAGIKIGLMFLAIALFDYLYQRYEFEKGLKMTKEEVKEETKMQDGNPVIKGRIRSIQRQIAYKRMMHDIPKADVVVTNPTHVAVAIKYDSEKMNAPRVVAKGAELIAKRIKEIAAEHHVPIVEDRILARTLYKMVDIGEEIPEKLFQAVAQLLAYIYRMKNPRSGRAKK